MSDDWSRYGGGRPYGRGEVGARQAGSDVDDPYLEYRHENGVSQPPRIEQRRTGRPRSSSRKLVGATAAVLLVAGTAFFLSLGKSDTTPTPTPSIPETLVPSASVSMARPTRASAPIVRLAHATAQIPLPLSANSPDRSVAVDDGESMYLIGTTGVLSISTRTGHVTVFGGSDFPKGLRKAVYSSGLWVSSWPATVSYCGPSCWAEADTYRVDPSTGGVSFHMPGAFLVGIANGDVVVATNSRLEFLDPASGSVDATQPWQAPGEPRVGCGSYWSFVHDSQLTSLSLVGPFDGKGAVATSMDADVAYGPVYIEGQCWIMTGSGGASLGSATLEWLLPNGGVFTQLRFSTSVVILDNEFWTYARDGTMQRLEPSSGWGYGSLHQLPDEPRVTPLSVFAAVGSLWAVDGTQLTGFDMATGASATNR